MIHTSHPKIKTITQCIMESYDKEALERLYFLHGNVTDLCKYLQVNYSTLQIVLKKYNISFRKYEGELKKSGTWKAQRLGAKRTDVDRRKQSETRKRLIAEGKLDVSKNLAAMRKAYKPVYFDTSIELALQKELTKRNIPFVTQKRIDFPDDNGFSHPDIFIEPNICIYANGKYWHSLSKVKYRDEYVSNKLKQYGYIKYSFSEDEINNNVVKCVDTTKIKQMETI